MKFSYTKKPESDCFIKNNNKNNLAVGRGGGGLWLG